MHVKIKRIDTSLPLPEYHTSGAAAFDMYAREAVTIPPRTLTRIPSNLIVCTPAGYALILVARSSLAAKKGLLMPNGVGVIDSDYCGPNDEVLISTYNFTDQEVCVERGERLVQGMFLKVDRGEWEEIQTTQASDRGGFGSTG